ncbi:MAG: hypothetical protein B7Z15_00850 [Rhizobiales bacterium 32-66-8]|jgi:alpha-ketoglutarate-dependent taurine dioxygenase|nr:MAG: hypothetical protein B7Z15_00850 [Rhizobiales bacterium 32-66-8]
MTTTVVVKASHGWPVDVTPKDPKTGAPLQSYPTVRVPPNEERAVYVHSGMDLHIHEVQPDEISEDPRAA